MIIKVKRIIIENFHALSHSDYRYFFFGQIFSLIGTWMQTMAQSWLVYTITNSAFKLGFVGTMQFLPTLLFSVFAGVWIDQHSKKKILILTQIISMVQALLMFLLVYLGAVQYWHIIVLAFVLGCTNAVDMPARQSFVIHLVGRDDVVNAVGLNSAVFNLARIIGPAIAGILISSFGMEWCFFINCVSFLPVIIGLFFINQQGYSSEKQNNRFLEKLKDGLRYVYMTPILLKILIIVLFTSVTVYNYNVLTPIFAKTTLGLQERGFGMLLSFLGVGSLMGAIAASIRFKKNRPRPRTLVLNSILIGFSLFTLGLCRNLYLALAVISLCGFFGISIITVANSLLQLNASEKYRGRVMSFYALVFGGAIPIGNFITGFIAHYIGAASTFMFMGAVIVTTMMYVQFLRNNW